MSGASSMKTAPSAVCACRLCIVQRDLLRAPWDQLQFKHKTVCPDCGSERCPRADSHLRECAGKAILPPAPLIVTLAWPDPHLNPNRSAGMHWSATANLRKNAKASANFLTAKAMRQAGTVKEAGGTKSSPVALTITFIQPDRRARDRDNLLAALKPSLDGVAQALGINDSEFEPVTIKREYGPKPGSVMVEIAIQQTPEGVSHA